MSRRPASLSRRLGDGASIPFMGSLNPKSRPSRSLSIGLTLMGAFLIICYIYSGLGGSISGKAYLSRLEGGDSCSAEISRVLPYLKKVYNDSMHKVLHVGPNSCTAEISRVLPYLKKVYNDSMHKVLHVGPNSCAVISMLSKEEETEAWGLEPYDLDDSDASCKSLIRKGVVRVADIKFPLPYRSSHFQLL